MLGVGDPAFNELQNEWTGTHLLIGSEMFIVYSDARDTAAEGFLPVFNRAFIVKVNRLVRF